MRIGPYEFDNPLILAPMSGITDLPFRQLCQRFGASLTISEMVSSLPHLQDHQRTLQKTMAGTGALRSVQILGTDPDQMAAAAQINAARGAHIIDINMGCPAKKVCSVAAGSALLRNEALVEKILTRVVKAVPIPVTLKIRTGWDMHQRNALKIATIAEASGIQALTIHGRTRACKFTGLAEYDTIAEVKQKVGIPVIANGDIDSVEKARFVLQKTGADALMIGRAAQGNPWIFRDILNGLSNTNSAPQLTLGEVQSTVNDHLEDLYNFYGKINGVRIARKHIGWYFNRFAPSNMVHSREILQAQRPSEQLALVNTSFNELTQHRA